MSRDEADAQNGKAADEANSGEPADGESKTDAGTAPDPGGAGKEQTDETATSPEPSDRAEFGLASDLATDRSGANDDAEHPRDVGDPGEAPSEGGADDDAPLSSLASTVSDRRADTGERPDDELFDEEEVPEIDADVVWERLGEDEQPEIPDDTEHDVRVIEKRSYCEQCPFFSTPPDVGCDHEGTEILELVDMDHFRVVDCPKVLEDERLERL